MLTADDVCYVSTADGVCYVLTADGVCYVFTADVPRQPVPPTLRHGSDGVRIVEWDEPDDGGSPIETYQLLCRSVANTHTQTEPIWPPSKSFFV